MYGRLKEYVMYSDDESETPSQTKNNKERIVNEVLANNKKEEVKENLKPLGENEEDYEYDKTAFLKAREKQVQNKNETKQKKGQVKKEKEETQRLVKVDYCGLCNKRINNDKEIEEHMISRLHIKKLKIATKTEMSSYAKLSDYLLDKGLIGKKKNKINKMKALLYEISLRNFLKN